MTTPNFDITYISSCLEKHHPELGAPGARGHAAVALLLRELQGEPEVLFIVRSEHEHDPWSGNIAFPGGRLNSVFETPRQAAERETFEELALDLKQAQYLGQLDDLFGAILPVLVSCFVFKMNRSIELQPNHEVASTFWCPLQRLVEPQNHKEKLFHYRGQQRLHPVVDLLGSESPFLWGITYRLIRNFFALCGKEFGSSDPAQ